MAEFLSSITARRERSTAKIKRFAGAREIGEPETEASTPVAPPQLSRPLMVVLGALCVGIFFAPLVYMPFASAVSEWIRQTLFIVVALFGLVATLIHIVRRKSISMPRHWLTLAAFVAAGLAGIVSALASKTRYLSLYGYDGTEGYAAITFFACALIAVLVTIVGYKRRMLYYMWLIASFFVMTLSLLSLYGVPVFPGVFAAQWTPFGGITTLVVIAALTIVAAYGILTEYRPPRAMYVVAVLSAFISLAVLVSVNNRFGFLVLAGGSLVFLIGAALRKEEILSRAMMAPCIGLFLSIIYLLMAIPGVVSTPMDVYVSISESARVAGEALGRNPVFGSGPGTFANEFLALRKADITKSGFGNTDFHAGAGVLFTSLVTLGILGTLCMMALFVVSLVRSGYGIIKDRRTGAFLAVQSVLVTALVTALFLPVHPTMLFLIAVFIGLSLAEGSYREISMARSEQGIALRNAAVAAVLLIVVVGTVIMVRRTGGVVTAVRAARSFGENPGVTVSGLTKALVFDNGHDGYWRMLADARRAQLNVLKAQAGNANPSPEVIATAQQLAAHMVEAATRASMLAPGSSRNWSSLGQARLVAGVGNTAMLAEAKIAFERARELNQHDPAIITALGVTERLLALANTSSGKPDTAKAVALLREAITLQPAYIGAHLELARLYAAEGSSDHALAAYGDARLAAPYDPRVAYEVAMYLRDQKKNDLAIAELERAVKLAPNFADALFVLADLYANAGDYTKAVASMEILVKLYPDNKDLQARLESFKEKAAAPIKKKK